MKNPPSWLGIIDTWLLDTLFQPFSNWFQRLTGQDNFSLAFHLLNLNMGIGLFTDLLLFKHDGEVVIFSGTILKTLICYPLLYKKVREKSRQPQRSVFLNSLRINPCMRALRVFAYIFWICGVVYLAGIKSRGEHIEELLIFIMANRFIFVGVVCFLSCTPLPPGKSKFSKWMSAAKHWITNLSQPDIEAPAPT